MKGRVTDESGAPVIGATVILKGTTIGTATNAMGEYAIDIRQADAVLVYSLIGYNKVELALADNQTQADVTLKSEAIAMDNVVVVGYGVQNKRDVTTAISSIKAEDFAAMPTADFRDAMAAKMPGVQVLTLGGQPDGNVSIRIRGIQSATSGNDPLYVIDGVPCDARAFSNLESSDIEGLEVLKDASAAAIYGSRGSCGVILITTKRGEGERPVVSYDGQFSVSNVSKTIDMLDAYEFARIFKEARDGAYLFNVPTGSIDDPYEDRPQTYHRVDPLITAYLQDKTGTMTDTDWQDAIFRTAYSTKHSVSVSGRTKTLGYYIGANYLYREGTIIGSDFERYSLRANIDGKRNRLKYGVSFSPSYSKTNYISSDTQYGDDGVIASALMAPPVFPVYNTDGSYNWDMNGFLRVNSWDTQTNEVLNPVALALEIDDVREKINILGNAYVSYEFIKGLEYKFTAGGDYYSYIRNYYRPSYIPLRGLKYLDAPSDPKAQNNMQSYFHWTISNQLSFNRTFGDHTVTALALFNQRENVKGTAFPYHSQGVVGRVTYDYKHKYLFECNLGYTGAEQFSPENRYGFFPSVAIGWVPSQERFWKEAMPWWSKLKIRYSDGLVGSDSGSRWLYFSDYIKGGASYIYEGAAANMVAQWEEARKRDLGIEMGWLNNRLTLNFDLFDEKRTNMLVKPNVTMLVGTSYKEVNRGSMKKHGIDIELGWADRTSTGFGYNLTAMLSLNENRITNYEDAPYAPEYQKTAGKPYKGQTDGVSIVDSGYFESIDDIHNYPAYTADWNFVNIGAYKYLDYSADGQLTDKDLHAIAGSQYPLAICSFNAGFSYKGFEFSMLWYANFGKWVEYNKSWEIEFNKGDYRITKSQLDYWRPDNRDADHATLVYGGTSGHPMYMWAGGSGDAGAKMMLAGRTWRKADYVALKEVYLAYTFNAKRLRDRVGFRSLSLYLTATNLFTLSGLVEGDPQSTTFTSGFYPQMTSVKLGVKIGF